MHSFTAETVPYLDDFDHSILLSLLLTPPVSPNCFTPSNVINFLQAKFLFPKKLITKELGHII